MSVFIHIQKRGEEEKVVEFPSNATIEFVENKMRSTYGVSNGTLSSVADRIVVVMSLLPDSHYHFRDFSEMIAHPGITVASSMFLLISLSLSLFPQSFYFCRYIPNEDHQWSLPETSFFQVSRRSRECHRKGMACS